MSRKLKEWKQKMNDALHLLGFTETQIKLADTESNRQYKLRVEKEIARLNSEKPAK